MTLYNGQHRATTEALVAAFSKATGIEVTVRNAESPELSAQIAEEGANSPADLFFSEQSPPIAALQEKGLLGKVDEATLKTIPAKFSAKDGSWIGATVRTRVITYNTKMISPADLPKSIMDFATPALKGKFAYVKQDGFQEQIMAIAHIKGRDAALAWLKGLKEYGRSYNGNRIASTAVLNGEIAMALSNNYYWYSLAREKGEANLDAALYSFPGDDAGNIFNVSAAGVLKSSKKQAAAQRFLAFMVSKPGQDAMVDTTAEYPVLDGVMSPFKLPSLETFKAPVTPADMGSAAEAYALEREAGLI
ncbi:MAG TPA: extracellular solute-binding protein [Stellaceae bacterium]|nr:extracellular solute-binding protein [Stellaceae bacterium]